GDLVLAPWEHDGHPDHDAVGRAALAATAALPGLRLLRYPVWAWHWLPPDASPPPFAAIRMPLPPATLARKRRAIACFASQLDRGGPGAPAPLLPPHVVVRYDRPVEVYLRCPCRVTSNRCGSRATTRSAPPAAGTKPASATCCWPRCRDRCSNAAGKS